MPCYDHRSSGSYIEEHTVAPLRQERDLLADLLCKAGRAAFAGEPVPADVIEWWVEHARFDALRSEAWPMKEGIDT